MNIAILSIFILGYLAITLEQFTKINKGVAAILTGVLCWTVLAFSSAATPHGITGSLIEHLGDIAGILFFLMGAMTIVELIDAHGGFDIVTSVIRTRRKRTLLWIIAWVTFFLSAVLDNLTTAIVMTALITKLVDNRNDRLILAGIVVIAANAGGAWSPIGDVTTTMLWIAGNITSMKLISSLFLPSIVSLVVPLAFLTPAMGGTLDPKSDAPPSQGYEPHAGARNLVFFTGIGMFLFVPVFKTITHLPPYMGILLGLGVLWLVTELLHRRKDETQRHHYTVGGALRRIDMQSILFFLGILLAISALQTAGHLRIAAEFLDAAVGDRTVIALIIGVFSAIIDNVPLVAGAIGMYDHATLAPDHPFWHLLAYTAGTGGSMLIIGSAAGVAVMGMTGMPFFWYVRKMGIAAVAGYCAGAGVFVLQSRVFG